MHDAVRITKDDHNYPALLREIPNPPSRLFIRGELAVPKDKTIAIVGTRRATNTGLKTAEELASKLAAAGFTIISGLAIGIDSAAHRGALKSGKTVAILGTDINSFYPRSNEQLGLEILRRGGSIISEYDSADQFHPQNFLLRNRIISGLSQAVVIIEAPEKSGSLATARAAAEQGREVFVFPGPANNPNYRGSHALIRDGARLVDSIEDVFSDLGIILPKESRIVNPNDLGSEEAAIVSVLRDAAIGLHIDKLVELTRLQPQTVNTAIATLVIKEAVKEENGLYELWKI